MTGDAFRRNPTRAATEGPSLRDDGSAYFVVFRLSFDTRFSVLAGSLYGHHRNQSTSTTHRSTPVLWARGLAGLCADPAAAAGDDRAAGLPRGQRAADQPAG